jgi:hypothetical protein
VLAAAVIVVGLVVLGVGPLLLGLVPDQVYWSEEEHAAYEKASTAAHAAAFGGEHHHSGSHATEPAMDSDSLAERDATRAEFEKQFANSKPPSNRSGGWASAAGCSARRSRRAACCCISAPRARKLTK